MKKLPRLGMNYTSHQYLNLEMMPEVSRIDKTIQFNSLKSGSKATDINAIQLNNSYVAVNNCIDSKSMSGLPLGSAQNAKFATYHHPHNIHVSYYHQKVSRTWPGKFYLNRRFGNAEKRMR